MNNIKKSYHTIQSTHKPIKIHSNITAPIDKITMEN